MPIWLRNFTYKKILEHVQTTVEKQGPKSTKQIPTGPDIKPTYSTKVSNK